MPITIKGEDELKSLVSILLEITATEIIGEIIEKEVISEP